MVSTKSAAGFIQSTPPQSALQLWGGVECSRVRVQDGYVDQLQTSGHRMRLSDLDAFAGLGVTTLRMPILWEHVWPNPDQLPDWSWPDAALYRLQELGIEPIVGLLHHGSGPADTHLLDEALPARLAAFAGMVAERYPWVRYYTPVNEPLTTARFSGLYGHWYPHASSNEAFSKALMIQIEAICQSMQAIRRITPGSVLVQTEDLGYTQSTPALAYQAQFENERRWLSFDLLAGRVLPGYAFYDFLVESGVEVQDLARLSAAPCPPGILGINHYITSERFLDRRLHLYPSHTHGGNSFQAYADVETCRSPKARVGVAALLMQAWERYRLPIAVTEAHIGCTPDEQVRWFYQMWQACLEARSAGADVRACTAWALIGSFDWDSLLTRPRGHYECGVFCLENDRLTPTLLSDFLTDIGHNREVTPIAKEPGWWNTPDEIQRLMAAPPVEQVVLIEV